MDPHSFLKLPGVTQQFPFWNSSPRSMPRRGGSRATRSRGLAAEKARIGSLTAKRAIEGDEGELRGRSESAEIGIGPIFSGGPAKSSQVTEDAFEAARFVETRNSVILEPEVISLPCLPLIHEFVTHHGFRRQKAEEAQLGEPAEEKSRVRRNRGKPLRCAAVVDVTLIGKGDPDVYIREKK